MSRILDIIADSARRNRPALVGARGTLSYGALGDELRSLAGWLQQRNIKRLGLYADNGPAWVVTDLACLSAGTGLVPLPGFFTPQQIGHALQTARVDHVL